MFIYKCDYFKEEDVSLKDDLMAIKNFLSFVKNDVLRKNKKKSKKIFSIQEKKRGYNKRKKRN